VEIALKAHGQVAAGINAGVPALVRNLAGSADNTVAGIGQRKNTALIIGGGIAAAIGFGIAIAQLPVSAVAVSHKNYACTIYDLAAVHMVAEANRICTLFENLRSFSIDGNRRAFVKQRGRRSRHRCLQIIVITVGKRFVFPELCFGRSSTFGAFPPRAVRHRVSAGNGGGAGDGAIDRLGHADGNLSLPGQRFQGNHAGDFGAAHPLYRHSITVNGTRDASVKSVKIELWSQYHRQIIGLSCFRDGGSRHFRSACKSTNGPCTSDVTKSCRGNTIRQGLPHNGTPHRDGNGRDRVPAYELCSRSRERRRGQ